MKHGVAIIGCGSIGQNRAKALGHARLVACCDAVADRAAFRKDVQRRYVSSWCDRRVRHDIDIVATTRQALPRCPATIEAGKHVLVEKPAARSLEERDR